jgi:hypothetical protein
MVRSGPEGPLDAVLVLGTLGAPERRRLRGRRARPVEEAEPEPVPTARARVVRPEPFGSREEGERWLAELRGDDSAMREELEEAISVLNRALSAYRAAVADPWLAEVSAERALVARIGYGSGDAVAEGRFGEAFELPRAGARRVKRSMEAPDERFAALLGGRSEALVGEELVLRARADLAAGRRREAALLARVGVEGVVAELRVGASLPYLRSAVAAAAGAALRGELNAAETASIEEAVRAMEAVLRRHRLRG